jgi:hypothetical protein
VIQTLVYMFPTVRLGVGVARNGTLYQSDIFTASQGPVVRCEASAPCSSSLISSPSSTARNPTCYETIKVCTRVLI